MAMRRISNWEFSILRSWCASLRSQEWVHPFRAEKLLTKWEIWAVSWIEVQARSPRAVECRNDLH